MCICVHICIVNYSVLHKRQNINILKVVSLLMILNNTIYIGDTVSCLLQYDKT